MKCRICLLCIYTVCLRFNLFQCVQVKIGEVLPKIAYPEVWYETPKGDGRGNDEAAIWLDNFNDQLRYMDQMEASLSWNFITNFTNATSKAVTDFAPKKTEWMKKMKKEAAKLDSRGLDSEKQRMLFIIRNLSFSYVDENLSRKNAEIVNKMSEMYSTTKVMTRDGNMAGVEPDLNEIMSSSKDYDELLFTWRSWRDSIGPKIRPLYTKMVEVENHAAKANGYNDMGEVWRSLYEVSDLEAKADAIWQQLKPLYEQFHAYVRRKLAQYYGEDKVGVRGPIPAHLLGNMWAQEWGSLIHIMKPYPHEPSVDVTVAMKEQKYSVKKIFRTAEDFYVSLGLPPMTDKFWKLSMLEKPGDGRKVDCHGSAEDFSREGDFRIKMCSNVDAESFLTAHHEMGHVQYFMAYGKQPEIFHSGANPGFHEAIGDSMTYSVLTPEHLKRIGLIDEIRNTKEADVNFLFEQALHNLPLIPWTLLLDLWRYDVFNGKINEKNYNSEWWRYRLKYQGIEPPVDRNESHFDPAAKFHICTNIPYLRYFFARILQLQFHSTMCYLAHGYRNEMPPLHRCDVYGSKNAGNVLNKMMSLGKRRPWWEALQVMTGSSELSALPILQYYKPLYDWLRRENERNGEIIGW